MRTVDASRGVDEVRVAWETVKESDSVQVDLGIFPFCWILY